MLFSLVTTLTAVAAAPVRLFPIDDTARDPAFRSYVERLQSAVDARKPGALRRLVDDDVVVGAAADDKGWKKFVATWRPDDRESPLWDALSDLLSLGFVREHPSLFVSPYLVWRFPRNLDPSAHLVVIRDKAALREAPSVNAPAAAMLSFDIVGRLGNAAKGRDELGEWVKVRTLDGKMGYLSTRDVMSPLMPRAQFGLLRGRWQMVALETSE